LVAALGEDLDGDLLGVVAGREADQGFPEAVAVDLDVAEGVARPSDGQEDQGDVGAGDRGAEELVGAVFLGVEPDQLVEVEGLGQRQVLRGSVVRTRAIGSGLIDRPRPAEPSGTGASGIGRGQHKKANRGDQGRASGSLRGVHQGMFSQKGTTKESDPARGTRTDVEWTRF